MADKSADKSAYRTDDRPLWSTWVKADEAVRTAAAMHLQTLIDGERRVGRLRQSERIAYEKLYKSVPCDYCGAKVGQPCITEGTEKHTARAADCMKSPTSGPYRTTEEDQ